MNWLITGGCGFIGCQLIKILQNENNDDHIRVYDNLIIGSKEDLSNACNFYDYNSRSTSPGVFLAVGDIRDFDSCLEITKNIDCVVHLAANTGVPASVENPRDDMEANVIGTFNMLEASRKNKVKQFIFASSGAPAGEIVPPIHEEMAPHPVSPYGSSKLAGEGYCSSYGKTFGINTIALRFGNVYGPGSKNKSSVVAKFMNNVLRGDACQIYGDGNQTRDFIYISDLIRAIIKASKLNVKSETFQIASGKEYTVLEVAQKMKLLLKKHNYKMVIDHSDERVGDVKRNFSDITKAKTLLGWMPEKNLDQGLKETIKYFLSN